MCNKVVHKSFMIKKIYIYLRLPLNKFWLKYNVGPLSLLIERNWSLKFEMSDVGL